MTDNPKDFWKDLILGIIAMALFPFLILASIFFVFV